VPRKIGKEQGRHSGAAFRIRQDAKAAIFSLHWRNSNVEEFAPYWLDERTTDRYLFGFPQSSQICGYKAYCWDDRETAWKDIERTYAAFKKGRSFGTAILAGASQGGVLAVELCFCAPFLDTSGFIAVVPAIKDVTSIEKLIKEKRRKDLKGCLITGDKDPYYQKTLELAALFEKEGIPCRCVVKEGMGHVFPDDFTILLEQAVEFLL
jgi:hypothetical protein